MRHILSLLILPLMIGPALAEEPAKAEAHHARPTWEQHFAQADLAHDGHLTLEEAKGGFALVAKHFADIDVDHKGYVTVNDIRAWRAMRKAARRLTHPPEDKLKPQPAYQRQYPDQHPVPIQRTAALPNEARDVPAAAPRM
jgi:hypothetical protein